MTDPTDTREHAARSTVVLAREQGYREGYAQAKADMQRELGIVQGLYSGKPGPMHMRDAQIAALVHVRTVLRALSNARVRRD